MDGYKKIIKSRKLRFKILSILKFVPDKPMLKLQYYIKHKRRLNLKNPKRYTEKIQWYKLYYRNSLMPICVDKYKVREYVKSKGLEHILNQLYGVYNDIEKVDWNKLPDKFVLKVSNGSGTNFLCTDKSKVNIEEVKEKFKDFSAQSKTSAGREWVYHQLESTIIAEALLEDKAQQNNSICDYKFLCFNGKPHYIVYDVNRFTDHRRNIYDLNWVNLNIESDCKCYEKEIVPPDNLNEMIEVAKVLSEDFPAVRVDLYSIGGKIYFGELTFFPWSGYVQYNPDEFDFTLGEKFILPEKSVDNKVKTKSCK